MAILSHFMVAKIVRFFEKDKKEKTREETGNDPFFKRRNNRNIDQSVDFK